jgi:ADP-heptose:LPS heptosyltransferase
MKERYQHSRELFFNHIWESLNAATKILFFLLVTPMMLSAWGRERFGLFAIANSCVAAFAFFDLGLRTLTRVGLTSSRLSEGAKVRLHALNTVAFSVAAGISVGIVGLLSLAGCWQRWLHLPQTGNLIITTTAMLAVATMWLQLLVERIAAAGRLSHIKAALFAGNLVAFAVVVTLLRHNATVVAVTATYFGILALPLLFLLPFANLRPRLFVRALVDLQLREILSALHVGGWINLITASWIFQSYGVVVLIAWMSGPTAAGIFFLYLKLSELLSVLGASASEPTIAAIAAAQTPLERHRHFATGYRSTIALCLAGAVGCAFFCGDLFRIWLHQSLDHSYTGLLIGLFGIAAGVGRMVTAASLGLAKPRPAALGLFASAIAITGSVFLFRGRASMELILGVGAASGFFLVPMALIVARNFESTFAETWLRPVAKFVPSSLAIVAVCWFATKIGGIIPFFVAAVASVCICTRYIFQRSASSTATPLNDSRLGYDTRSWRSALVMKGIDLINPFRRTETFFWTGPCVVSSIAGLGDLFVHLPLIAGIVKEAERRGFPIHVALRSEHKAIGVACGWEVITFDDTLVDFFKTPEKLRPLAIWNHIRQARRERAALWIDLTGNAVGALAIKAAGARKLAARITRGGRSLVNHPLPHTLQENEYGNVARVAVALGCQLDETVFDRLCSKPVADLHDRVVLCLTTAFRWKSWPLENFLEIVDRFPETQFVATGLDAEIVPEERAALDQIIGRPNVVSLLDEMSILQLIHLIAHSRAVVTADTSTSHIATAFRKPGAVLFGPTSPSRWGGHNGLKSFVEDTCPFHPCVQWACRNQENWCMRKIDINQVAGYLATLPAFGNVGTRLATQPQFVGLPAAAAQW